MAATAQQCHAMTNHFVNCYKEKYGAAPNINRNVARAQFGNILMDLSTKEVIGLIDYYFDTFGVKNHDLTWFFYNYDKLLEAQSSQVVEQGERDRLMQESKQRVKEWRERGRQGITGN